MLQETLTSDKTDEYSPGEGRGRGRVRREKKRARRVETSNGISSVVVEDVECVVIKPITKTNVDSLIGSLNGLTLALSSEEVASVNAATELALEFGPILNTSKSNNTRTQCPPPPLTVVAVMGVLREALTAAAVSFCSRAAQVWAEGFTFPKDARETDAAMLQLEGGDLYKFISAKRAKDAHIRLSEERVRAVIRKDALTDKKDYGRLMAIARGIEIETEPNFVPSGYHSRPKMRLKYTRDVPNAVNKLIHKQWVKSTVVLLPTELLANTEGVHFSPIHWTTKAGKAEGRVLGDTSNGEKGAHLLNGNGKEGKKYIRERMIKRWGAIKHPTLEDLVLMVLEAADLYGWDEIELWKTDLAAAFNLMNFSPKSAALLTFELSEGLSVIHTTGMFGWTGTPYVFQVITRVLCDTLRPVLKGLVKMYVDDMFGAVAKRHRQGDMTKATELIHGLLGPTSVAHDKTEFGRQLELLGWLFDLDLRVVSASRKNVLKAIHVFFNIDIDGMVLLEDVERVASYASRYSVLSRAMKPYTAALHRAAADYAGNHHAQPRRLTEHARCDIVMWRAYLCLLRMNPENFARPLESFRPRAPSVLIEYDASLEALGVGVSVLHPGSSVFRLVGYTQLVLPYKTDKDSSYQNTNEYAAVLLGLALIKQERLVPGGFAYNIIGDNTTSLSWCKKGKAASLLARRANIGFSLLCVELDANIAEIKHVPGIYNKVYDGLSRGLTGRQVGLPIELEYTLESDSLATKYIALCNPRLPPLASPSEHLLLSQRLLALLGSTVN
jgi:hypothetical protein